MPSINQVTIMGHLGRDPEVRFTRDGSTVVNCTVATEHRIPDRDPITEWHRVVAFGVMAEQLMSATKGQLVTIMGRLQTRSWDDKQSGQKRYQTEIVADVAVVGQWTRRCDEETPRRHPADTRIRTSHDEDEIPF